MFLFGSTGTILPYIITLIALWSGVLLGYGQIFALKKTPLPDKEITVEINSNHSEQLAIYTDFENKHQSNSNKGSQVSNVENLYPKINVLIWRLHNFIILRQIPTGLNFSQIFSSRGPPDCYA
jgi:hypothetical protein